MTCEPTRHTYQKFDETTVFCRRCGESKTVSGEAFIEKLLEALRALPQPTYPVYLPCPGPHYPQWQPYTQPYIWYGTTTTSGSITTGSAS